MVGFISNPTYQAQLSLHYTTEQSTVQSSTLQPRRQPDWIPFNSLGAGVANKRQYKTAKVSDLPHIFSLTKF